MNTTALAAAIADHWDSSIVDQLVDYVRIPAKSPHFDPDWEANGHIERVIRLAEAWVREQVAQLERMDQLKRFFSPPVADAIVSAGENSILAPHRREICYVFVDLRGFTAFTDAAEPEEVQAVLHDYHAAMGALITEHEGTLDRFAGDGILIFFNDPIPIPEPEFECFDLGIVRSVGLFVDVEAPGGRPRWTRPQPRTLAAPRKLLAPPSAVYLSEIGVANTASAVTAPRPGAACAVVGAAAMARPSRVAGRMTVREQRDMAYERRPSWRWIGRRPGGAAAKAQAAEGN